MKKFILLLAYFINILSGFSQQAVDTTQVVILDRVNTTESTQKPYVILISADGFRYDYAEKYNAKNINQMGQQGVKAKAMLPSYPSITFPNHWSIITGLYPSHHGIVDNYFKDYNRNESYKMSSQQNAEDGSWYGGVPLWSLAESQGMLAASLQWVGSASNAGGIRPTYYYRYHEKFTPQEKIKKVVDWLKLPENKRPHFISLYFPEVDSAGHFYGPNSEQTKQAVALVDQAISKLIQEVGALKLDNVNFIFVSDHGMKEIDGKKPIAIPFLLQDASKYEINNAQTLLRVHVKNKNNIEKTYQKLNKKKTDNYNVYLASNFPEELHYGSKDDRYNRIGDILLVPNSPYVFLENWRKTSTGKHGYNVYTEPDMKAIFYAYGPAFNKNMEIEEFENIHIYPLIAKLLDLQIEKTIDGKQEILAPILK
jgi:predicted AlkP superfamily pyrophosphatase or phosphodiesterase